ncbi:MAG: hypothetical protein HY619_08020 [Thaumarchaeota archaeon]|nr:hypothetical protein [Nitrososphaerota archaeon]
MKTVSRIHVIYFIMGVVLIIIYSIMLGGFANALIHAWVHVQEDFEQLDVHLFIAGTLLALYGGVRLALSQTRKNL